MATHSASPSLPKRHLQFASLLVFGCLVAQPMTATGSGWTFVTSPNGGSFTNSIVGIDASSNDYAWAVGTSTNSLLDRVDTLALRWDGATWIAVSTPNPDPAFRQNRLYDVAVIGESEAWAVGSTTFGPTTSPLILLWDGASWQQLDVSDELPNTAIARAIHAFSSNDIWVVGQVTQAGTGFGTLAARYEGTNWTAYNVPIAQFGGIQLQAVDGSTSDDVWAVGYENPGNGVFAPLVAYWDGTDWSSDNPPQPVGGCTLHDVTTVAVDDVWAVGTCPFAGAVGDQPYAVHWDGASWEFATLPILRDGHARLEGVAALASDDIWAVGTKGDPSGIPDALLMHFDGFEWSVVEPPATGGTHEWLRGITVAGDSLIAGGQFFSDLSSTLTMHLRPVVIGDIDGDSDVDSSDYSAFVAVLLGVPQSASHVDRSDLNNDGHVNGLDISLFVAAIVES